VNEALPQREAGSEHRRGAAVESEEKGTIGIVCAIQNTFEQVLLRSQSRTIDEEYDAEAI
jgi:hypothetical protein